LRVGGCRPGLGPRDLCRHHWELPFPWKEGVGRWAAGPGDLCRGSWGGLGCGTYAAVALPRGRALSPTSRLGSNLAGCQNT